VFLGHYALALTGKRVALTVSLGTFILAAQWLDLLWPIFLLAGVEQVRIEPGLMEGSPLDFVHYPYTHSLLAAVLWGLVLGGVYFLARRNFRNALVVGALVVSHWVLDAVVHRPDLPLWPGSQILVGLGLWNHPLVAMAIELVLLGVGLLVYVSVTTPRNAKGRWGLRALVVFLLVVYFGAAFGPPPPDVDTLAWSALLLWLLVPWGYWVDRHRLPAEGRDIPPASGREDQPLR
jgi:membrane-bound metal-dependent hydrolase YbcI (DUF457 family)